MDPRRWSGLRLVLFVLAWPLASLAAIVLLGGNVMAAAGPSGGLIGVSLGALIPVALFVLGPPLVALGLWLAGRSGTTPPAG